MNMKTEKYKETLRIALIVFLALLTFLTRFGEVYNSTLFYASSISVFLVFAIFLISNSLRNKSFRVDISLVIFAITLFISLFFSHYLNYSVKHFLGFFSAILFSLLIFNLKDDSDNLQFFLKSILFIGTAFAFVSYIFYYSVEFGVLPSLSIYAQKYSFVVNDLLISLWQYQNSFAAFLVFLIFIAFGFFFYDKNIYKRIFYFAISVFLIFALIITGSRGGYIAFAVALVIFTIFSKREFLKVLSFELLAIVIALSITPLYASPFTFDVILNKNTQLAQFVEGVYDSSLGMRVYMAKFTIEYFIKHPFKPVGLGGFENVYCIYRTVIDKIRFDPHSLLLRLLIETGFWGLIAFLLFALSSLYDGFKRLKSNTDFLYLGLFAGTVGLFAHMSVDVDSLEIVTLFYLFTGLMLLKKDSWIVQLKPKKFLALSIAVLFIAFSFVLTPKLIGSLYALSGDVNLRNGNNPSAIGNYKKAIDLDFTNATYHYLLGESLKKENPVEAIKEYEIASTINKLDFRYPYAIGTSYLDMGNSKAIEYLERASNLYPTNTEIKGLLGISYVLLDGDFEKANTIADEVLKLDSNSSNGNILKGFILLNDKNYKDAREYFVKGIKAQSKNPYGQLGLAFYYNALGDREQIKERFRYLQAIDPILAKTYSFLLK